jgi:DNA adenine methylase
MKNKLRSQKNLNAKPFLKWAGGKTQLLEELVSRFPDQLKKKKKIDKYVEPFVGGGAMFFFLKNNFEINKSYLFDINRELIIGYKVIKRGAKELIKKLKKIEKKYFDKPEKDREDFYYKMRDAYNKQMIKFEYKKYSEEWIDRAAYLIFLNKTCYNGLFRQNKKGEFNVPFGRYKKPTICDEENILAVQGALKNTKIFCKDFSASKKYIDENTFVYLDPPYRPINKTSSFTSYAKEDFNEKDQKRLAEFFKEMYKRGADLMLSNSDPKNENPNDDFFDNLYSESRIERVFAKRFINCNASKRGEIKELVIWNYR